MHQWSLTPPTQMHQWSSTPPQMYQRSSIPPPTNGHHHLLLFERCIGHQGVVTPTLRITVLRLKQQTNILEYFYVYINEVLTIYYNLSQGWANYGPRAACGPPGHIMRPVGMYMLRSYVDVNFLY